MKKTDDVFLIGILFGLVGYLIIITGICVMTVGFEYAFVAKKATGVITEIKEYKSHGEIEHVVYVDYTYKRKQYTHIDMYYYKDNMSVGKEITIKITPDHPNYIVLPEGDLTGGILLAIFGSVFAVLGTLTTIAKIRKFMKKRAIISSGRFIYATVKDIALDYSCAVNHEHPFVIYCTYNDEYSGYTYTFKSEHVWIDPGPYLSVGSQVRVFVDRQDYSQYHVDIEGSLKGKVPEYSD